MKPKHLSRITDQLAMHSETGIDNSPAYAIRSTPVPWRDVYVNDAFLMVLSQVSVLEQYERQQEHDRAVK